MMCSGLSLCSSFALNKYVQVLTNNNHVHLACAVHGHFGERKLKNVACCAVWVVVRIFFV
jgi:hypothetical protein